MKKKKSNNKHKVSLGTTLYDLNKDIIEKNIEPLNKEQLEEKKELIFNYIEKIENKYYMVLCHEKRDYTIFSVLNFNNKKEIANILLDECFPNRNALIKSIELIKDEDAIEIWVSMENESFCYYLFGYDNAIIEI